ncbi:MAG: MGMT family protein [Alphaproteobacteria bacterium]|nr:MGMT family protein [Alphaproteobacteria bacterium]
MAKGFNDQVYDVVARIPSGRVASFGQIANMIGRPRMARFVGYASNNKNSWHLPWHRVVFKDGSLCSGFATEQYRSLRAEGVQFTDDKRVIMEMYQWDPERDGVPLDIRDFPLVF